MSIRAKGINNIVSIFFVFFLIMFSTSQTSAYRTESPPLESADDPQVNSDTLPDSRDNNTDSELNDLKGKEAGTSKTSGMSTMGMTSSGGSGGGATGTSSLVTDISLFTGAATSKIPILVPPGRNGISPNLSLSYNSYQKNGWIGVGWNLDMGSIRRSTKKGLDYTANDFVAGMNGPSDELVQREDWGSGYYGVKIEGTFYKYYLNPSTGGWEVTTKDGTVYYYGTTVASRHDDPSDSSKVFKWCLDKVEDTNGNYMTVSYVKPDYQNNGQIYLDTIEYTGNGSLEPSNYVKFYLKNRNDNEVMYTSHFKVVTAKRLETIEVHADGNTVRAYVLQYTQSAGTSRSLISSVQQYGSDVTLDGNGTVMGGTALPPTNLDYKDGDGTMTFTTYANPINTGAVNGGTAIYVGDWNGDGMTDVMWYDKSDGYNYWFVNNGDMTFTTYANPINTTAINRGTRIYVGDWNGDGMTDVMWYDSSDGQNYWFVNNGDMTFTTYANPIETTAINSGTAIYVGDWNGDGLTDIMWYDSSDGQNYWFVNNGDMTFTTYANPIETTAINSGTAIYVGDWNGDGLTDIMWYDSSDGQNYWFVNNGDMTFTTYANPIETTAINSGTAIYVGDWNGDGLTDIMWYDSSDGQNYWFVNNGNPPDLITSITKPLGATTTIEYANSSQYENTLLPYILHPVSSITIDDGLGNQSTANYHYHGGLYDYGTRELRGFEYVKQTNHNGTTVETWFYQDEFFKGRQEKVEIREPASGALLNKIEFTWEKIFLDPSENTAFIKLTQKRSEFYDGVTLISQENFNYDDTNGNLLTTISSGPDAEMITTTNQYQNYGDWLWRLTQTTLEGSNSGKVRETYFDYEAGTGNMLYKESWLDGGANPRINMTYDNFGNQLTVTDALGNVTSTVYDAATHTYPIRMTYPSTGGVAHIVENEEWDYRFGKVKITKDENGNRTYYTYDVFGRTIQVDYPDGGQALTEYHEYEQCGDQICPGYIINRVKEDSLGNFINVYAYFDGLGRKIQTIAFGENNKSIVSKLFYDEMGRNYLAEGPFFGAGVGYPKTPPSEYPWVETTFDYRGRAVEISSPNDEYGIVSITCDYSGYSAVTTDPDGSQSTEKKDYLGRIIQVIEHADAGLQYTNYTYNAAGDMLSVTDHHGNQTTINYDTLGRKINMTDPDMGFWQYTYDANGNLKTQTDAKNQVITFTYDNLNRVTQKSYSTSDSTVTYTYDLSIQNGIGYLYSVTNSNVTTNYNAYDTMGRAVSVSKQISGDPNTYTTVYGYV